MGNRICAGNSVVFGHMQGVNVNVAGDEQREGQTHDSATNVPSGDAASAVDRAARLGKKRRTGGRASSSVQCDVGFVGLEYECDCNQSAENRLMCSSFPSACSSGQTTSRAPSTALIDLGSIESDIVAVSICGFVSAGPYRLAACQTYSSLFCTSAVALFALAMITEVGQHVDYMQKH